MTNIRVQTFKKGEPKGKALHKPGVCGAKHAKHKNTRVQNSILYTRAVRDWSEYPLKMKYQLRRKKIGNFVNSFDWFKLETLGTEDKY